MNWMRNFTVGVVSSLFMVACTAQISTGKEDNVEIGLDSTQQADLLQLQQATGGTANIELNTLGNVRKLFMEPGFPLRGFTGSPSKISQDFLQQYRGLFRLDATAASQFFATREDPADDSSGTTVTLTRFVAGFPVYQGALTLNIDTDGGITDVLGDPSYAAGAPVNELAITPDDAAIAFAESVGVNNLAPQLTNFSDNQSSFSSTKAQDIVVEPKIFQVEGTSEYRFAYQVSMSWVDQGESRYELALVDAQTRQILTSHSLVHDFRGKVFLSHPVGTGDSRVLVSFDGDPTASPSGWVDGSRSTRGNNAIAGTDFSANDVLEQGEVIPVANATGDFVFNFSNSQNASAFPSAAVVNAFFLVNDWHDKLYPFGFTEAAGNFQTNNFGRGGRGNDAVRVDVQDGSGTDNANFSTPPDGQAPRMQMFLFSNGSDGDFDASVVYHENTHGLSTRLVGGGSPGCLFGLQSGAMGEGWSDFVAAMLLNDPVIGAYVTDNQTTGIRRANMANSSFTYNNFRNGQLTEAHDGGEIWAATLFDIKKALGTSAALKLVVRGMKLTPCSPSMLDARDGIIQADRALNNGANRCILEQIFANRAMGVNAFSRSDNSVSDIVTSTAISSACQGGGNTGSGNTGGNTGADTVTLSAGDLPVLIPDNNQNGASSTINIPGNLDVQRILIDTRITHSFRGDLQVFLIAPDQTFATLSDQAGGSADNFNVTGFDVTDLFSANTPATGDWTLFVRDVASGDAGVFNQFRITVVGSNGQGKTFSASSAASGTIPDASTAGATTTISATTSGLQIQSVQVRLNIIHSFRGDVQVFLTSPAGETRTVVAPQSGDSADNIIGAFNVAGFTNGTNGTGTWTLRLVDRAAGDVGSLNGWSLGVNTVAP